MSEDDKKIIAYKGFDRNWTCRGFQYEIGQTYEHEGPVEPCQSGFHSCEYPLDVFNYYLPGDSVFAVVSLGGETKTHSCDTKIASAKITIETEIKLPDLIKKAVEWVFDRTTPENSEHAAGIRGAASSTGDRGAASSTGTQGAASSTGDRGAASSTGYQGAASSTGTRGAASSTGYSSIAIASGRYGKAMSSEGSAIVLCRYDDDGNMTHVRSAIAGRGEIKPLTWYTLDENGEFKEVTSEDES
ncbi:MAG: collagen-like triple helix repeat-containing protein [Methylobacter sp.]